MKYHRIHLKRIGQEVCSSYLSEAKAVGHTCRLAHLLGVEELELDCGVKASLVVVRPKVQSRSLLTSDGNVVDGP